MLGGTNSNSEEGADGDHRIYADGERVSLYQIMRLEKKLDDMTMAFLQMGTKLAEFESKILKLQVDINELSSSIKRNAEHDDAHKFKIRYLNLQFLDKISSPVRTGDEIKGVGGDYLKVALVDETGKLMDSGPESTAEVHIFALKGDVHDENEGDSGVCFGDTTTTTTTIATDKERKTKKEATLRGDLQLKLNKGIGILSNIKFTSSPNHVSGMFKLGVRVVDSFRSCIVVQEAMTTPFRVRDYRGKYTEKHRPPCLSDEVWRLDNIGRGGSIHFRLKNLNFYTVEDFLIFLLKNSEGLKELVSLPQKKWDATVKHALTCQLDEKMYCSIQSEENSGIVFNAVGKVLGLISESKYLPMDKLSHEAKVNARKLNVGAFVHKNGLNPFPNEASDLQQFPKLAEPLNPSQLTMSENAMMDHEEEGEGEVSETVESHHHHHHHHHHQLMTNCETHFEDIPNSSSSHHPLEIEEYFGEFDIESLWADCECSNDNQNNNNNNCSSFSEMLLQESPVVVQDNNNNNNNNNNEVKKKLMFLFTVTKWFLNYEKMAASTSSSSSSAVASSSCCCDGNDDNHQKRRRIC